MEVRSFVVDDSVIIQLAIKKQLLAFLNQEAVTLLITDGIKQSLLNLNYQLPKHIQIFELGGNEMIQALELRKLHKGLSWLNIQSITLSLHLMRPILVDDVMIQPICHSYGIKTYTSAWVLELISSKSNH